MPMYALFVYDWMINCMTYAHTLSNKEQLIEWALNKFNNSCWFAVYKFERNTFHFGGKIKATKWILDTTVAGKTAKYCCSNFTPLETAFKIDDDEWYFNSNSFY